MIITYVDLEEEDDDDSDMILLVTCGVCGVCIIGLAIWVFKNILAFPKATITTTTTTDKAFNNSNNNDISKSDDKTNETETLSFIKKPASLANDTFTSIV
eukprot:TRINITY_DN694988_c0_g1_i1.p1 TRINITY_DN694988_c0_g1~~TRINITY_DN694988_c0_g1_i1.p1  ORF type:complete len:100 (-),score=36.11 TRINITY_DN694988_c0_g1_i1:492-791(-)